MKLSRKMTLWASVALAATCTPTMASSKGRYVNGIWQLSDTTISGTFYNHTPFDVAFSNVHWTGRYGTANSDGTITDRIGGTVASGKTKPSFHRMGDLDIGERYTELSFDATFTRPDGSTGTCYFWYAFKTDTEQLSGSAQSPGGSDKNRLPQCKISINDFDSAAFKVTFDMTEEVRSY
jgi:hypothetical protein